MTTIKNDFHKTEARTRYTLPELNNIYHTEPANRTPAESSLVRRLHDKLCGSPDCTCGGPFGERPFLVRQFPIAALE